MAMYLKKRPSAGVLLQVLSIGKPLARAWLRVNEIALHGYSHLGNAPARNRTDWLSGRSQTRRKGEFARLTFDEASIRLQSGLDWLRRRRADAPRIRRPTTQPSGFSTSSTCALLVAQRLDLVVACLGAVQMTLHHRLEV